VTDKKLTKAPPVHEWFEKAAEAGDLIGAYNFGVCLARGVGIPRDDARAAVWMRRAAEAVPDAQYWYGRMRFEGIGVPADPEEAVVWLQRAADANVTLALVTLADLKVSGRGCKKNVEEAINLFKRAAETGHAGAMFALAQLYAIEKLSSFDQDFANEWLSSAAKRGHLRATEILSQKDKGDRNTAQISESVNARRPIYHRPMRLQKFHWHPRRRHPIDDWS
jgi:TPR repeat protein